MQSVIPCSVSFVLGDEAWLEIRSQLVNFLTERPNLNDRLAKPPEIAIQIKLAEPAKFAGSVVKAL